MADDDTPDQGDAPDTASDEDLRGLRDALKSANAEAKKHRLRAKELEDQLQQSSDASKSELQKLTERLDAAEKRQAAAERQALIAEVAAEKKLPPALARRLTGDTREELENDAADLLEALGHKPDDNGDGGEEGEPDEGTGSERDTSDTDSDDTSSRRPREKLRGGASPEDDETPTPAEIVASIPRY